MAISASEYLKSAQMKPQPYWQASKWMLDCYHEHMARLCNAFCQDEPKVILPCHKHLLALKAAQLAPDYAQVRYGLCERWIEIDKVDWSNESVRSVMFGRHSASDHRLQPTHVQKVKYVDGSNKWNCGVVATHAWTRHVARAGRALAMYLDQKLERPRYYEDFERASASLDGASVTLGSGGPHEQSYELNGKWLLCTEYPNYDLACAIDEHYEALVAANDVEVCIVGDPDAYGVRARHVAREDPDGDVAHVIGVTDNMQVVLVPKTGGRFFLVP